MNFERLYKSLIYICDQNYKNPRKNKEVRDKLEEKLMIQGNNKSFFKEFNRIKKGYQVKKKDDEESGLSVKWVLKITAYSVVLMNIYVEYGLSLLIPAEIGLDNIYLDSILMALFEGIGYLTITFYAHKIARRKLNLTYIYSCIMVSFLLFLIQLVGLRGNIIGKLLETLLSVLIKMFVAMNFVLVFLYGSELFPTKLRGLAMGIALLCGRLIMSVVSQLDAMSESLGIHPNTTIVFSAMIALPFAYILPETLNKKMLN